MPARPPRRSLLVRFAPSAVALAVALQVGAARAVEPFVLKDIRVEGLQRTDAGTVFASLPFRIGDTYTDEKGAAALRALFATGLFKDVRIDIDKASPSSSSTSARSSPTIDFVGLKEFEKDALIKSLKDFGIGEGLPFDKALADRAEQELKRQYLTRSLYGAEVVTTVTPQERNRVNVTFTMTEGDRGQDQARSASSATRPSRKGTLKGLFELNDGGWLNWYTEGRPLLARQAQRRPRDAARLLPEPRLPRDARSSRPRSRSRPTSRTSRSRSTCSEGQPYTVTGVKLEGDYLGKEDDFKTLVAIRPGEPYRAEAVAATTRAFVDRFGTFGYAFAKVESRPEIDRANGRVVVTLVAEPQRRVYVRRINVAGNTRTRDEVVRREFRQFESSWYDGRKIKLSRDRVDRLGYFSDVSVDTAEVPGSADQVDLTITIKEKPTGNLSLGAGFSSADKLSLTASIKQENIFGSGNYLGFEINTSKYNKTLVLSTVDPYFTIDGISRAIDLYYRTSRPINSQGEEYELVTPGFAVRFGVPFSEYDTVFFGIGAERTEIKGATQLPNSYFLYREQFGDTSNSLPLTHRLDARQPRQRPGADGRPLHARQPRLGPARRRQVRARQPAGPAVLRDHHGRSRSASTPRSATARVSATVPIRSSRTSTAAAWARCGASSRDRSARSTSPAPSSAAIGASTSTTSSTCRCRARAPTGRCASSSTPTSATSGARTRKSPSTACAPRPDWA